MPIHDWSKVDAGSFHAFHVYWIAELARALNRGILGPEYYALPEQVGGGFVPDVLTLKRPDAGGAKARVRTSPGRNGSGGLAVADAPPTATFHITDFPKWYGLKKSAVAIHHVSGNEMVAVVEVVSSGNKSGKTALEAFVGKARELLSAGIHLMLLDLYPPTRRDPHGIHPEVWGDDDADTVRFDRTRPLTCASYLAGLGAQAFVEPVGVGDPLPELPLFLTPSVYVVPPLEQTYRDAFAALPEYVRDLVPTTARRKRK